MTWEELIEQHPLMRCDNSLEFKQRLQWLSEGMLANHLNCVTNYTPNQKEIAAYCSYRSAL